MKDRELADRLRDLNREIEKVTAELAQRDWLTPGWLTGADLFYTNVDRFRFKLGEEDADDDDEADDDEADDNKGDDDDDGRPVRRVK